ncbi:hypothetical protein GIB67_014726 [Kingdonia uniflora]|uniref:Aminotransferase-like plant mobile domain-containing protein n=1 Tax=Kingdonia uniflora TaxID=39325 RepID=A0A7J7NUR9_9MAGN|nr:hypothetical protein GIB67_014726 [Kingdonia uniflora]
MRPYDTFTAFIKVWNEIYKILTRRDPVVKIFGRFMDIKLGNSDNQLIQALTERWLPTTHTFIFPCAEIVITPLDFTMLTSLPIGKYPTQLSYDDRQSVISEAMKLLPRITSNNTKSGNVIIAYLKKYLTVTDDRSNDSTVARAFILFMMRHLWFQTANNTIPLRYLEAMADLGEAPSYDWGFSILASLYYGLDTAVTTGGVITGFSQLLEYCGVGHPIVNNALKMTLHPRLKAWEKGNWKKTNNQVGSLFTIASYLIDHQTIESINWRPWDISVDLELDYVHIAITLSRMRMPLKVLNGNFEYYLGDRC